MLQVVGVSEWLIGRMRKQEMGRFRMWHIPNGVDTEFFSRRRNARAQLGYAEDAQIILFLSSRGRRWELNPNKGLVDLADAFIQKIITRHPRAILAIGGEWLTPNHPQVRGLGYVTREMLPVWYSAASVYVLPTRGDNLPFTVLEAMACECPVVASDIGGVCEQIDPGVTGHLVPPNNPDALAEAVIRILEAGGKTEMGAAARDRVQRLFSMELFVQRHEQLYEFLSTRNQRTVQPATAFEVVK